MEYSKSELIDRLRNVMREGWSDKKVKDLVDSLWRDQVIQPDGRISGGLVTHDTGLTEKISPTVYRLGGKIYRLGAGSVTHDAADATYPRIDVIAVNNLGQYVIIKGTPSANPIKPSVNPQTQIELTEITINAGATTPDNITEGTIYNEHVAGEWAVTTLGVTVNADSTAAPSKGSKCIVTETLENGDEIVFTAPEMQQEADWTTLNFDIKMPDTHSRGHFLNLYFTNGGSPRSDLVAAEFERINTGWQAITLAIADFAIRNSDFDGLTMRWENFKGETYPGVSIDNVRLQKGIELPATTDTYTTALFVDEETGELVLQQNNGQPEKRVELPGEENVQSDWNQTDNTADDYIKNKPTIPAAQVNADWNASGTVAEILNKPTIPAAQIQSDWNQSNNTAADFIKNKPDILGSTDEKVKYDAGDTAAGYLAEKMVAGANVAITEGTGVDENKVKVAVTGLATVATSGSYNDLTDKPTIPSVNSNYLKDWIEFEFRDIEAGTAADYVLDLKALVPYTIDSAVMQVDDGTLTVGVKIGTTAVTSLSAVTVDTDIDETTATGANAVSAGNKVILAVSTTYTGSPSLIRGKLNLTRT